MASDFLSGLWDDVSSGVQSLWDTAKNTDEYRYLSDIADAGNAAREGIQHGIGLGAKTLSNVLDFANTSPLTPFINADRDPFEGIKARVDQNNNFHADVPDVGTQAADLIPEKYKGFRAATRGLVNTGSDPTVAAIPQIGGIGDALVGAGFLAPMVPSLSEKVGKGVSLTADQGKSLFSPEMTELYGEAFPEALMLGAGLHGLRDISKPISEALPEVKLGDGYTSRSPIELETPWMREPYRAGDELPVTGRTLDTDSGLASAITQRLYHGTGDRTWAEGGQPFSSRKASSENLYGGPFYFTKEPAIAEGQYAVAGEGQGEKPGIISADVTTNKTFDLDAPVPRDVMVRGLAEIQRAINEAENPQQAKYFRGQYDEFKNAKSGRDAQSILGDILDKNITIAEDMRDAQDAQIPLRERGEKSPQDQFNNLIEQDLGYDSLTHKSHLGHQVTIPFSRRQIETRDIQPVNPLEDRHAQSLIDEWNRLRPSTESHRPLRDAIEMELRRRDYDLSRDKSSILNDPELGPKFISNLEARVQKEPWLQSTLDNAKQYLEERGPINDWLATKDQERSYQEPKLTPEEEALVNPPKKDDSELLSALLEAIKGKGVPGGGDYYKTLENMPETESLGHPSRELKASPEQVARINETLKQLLSEEGLNHPVEVKDLPSPETKGPKPIELGQMISDMADKLGVRDIIAPGLNTVSKIAPGWGPYPKEVGKEIAKSEAPPSAIGPTAKAETTRLGNPSLTEKQQELFDRLQKENPEDPTIQRVREAMTKRISERVGGRGENEAVQTKSLGPESGSVVDTEGEGKKIPHQVFLNDGSVHTIKAADATEAQEIAEKALAEKGSDKQVVDVKEKLSSLETAASIPASQRDIKQIDKITKAQDLEDIRNTRNVQKVDEAAHVRDLKQQLATEAAYKKAQEQAAKRQAREAEKKAKQEEAKGKISTRIKNSDSPIARLVDEITSIPTTLKTLGHFSYPMRQGFFSITRPEALSGIKEGFKSFFSKDVHERILKDLESRPNAENYKKFGLQQVSYDDAVANRAEEFPGKATQKYIPLAERSSRGFQDTGNLVRANEWDMWDKVFKSAGKNPDTHPQDYKYMTDYLNDKTRRPELPDVLKGAGYLANKLMFTPRGYLAKWNLMKRIGSLTYGAPKEMKLGILRDLHGSLAIAGAITASVYQAAKAAGEDVETSLDPRSKMFGRVKVGHTTYDLFSGLNPIITDTARVITGKAISAKGNTYDKLPTGESVRSAALGGHIRNQLSPFAGAVWSAIKGENNIGQPETFGRFLADIGEPLMTAEMRKGYENWGLGEAIKNIPGVVGTHTQVDLTPEEEKERKESKPIMIPRKSTGQGKGKSGHKSKFKF